MNSGSSVLDRGNTHAKVLRQEHSYIQGKRRPIWQGKQLEEWWGGEAEGVRDQIFSGRKLQCSVKDGSGMKTGRETATYGNDGGLSHHKSNGVGIVESYSRWGILDQDKNEVPNRAGLGGNKGGFETE